MPYHQLKKTFKKFHESFYSKKEEKKTVTEIQSRLNTILLPPESLAKT